MYNFCVNMFSLFLDKYLKEISGSYGKSSLNFIGNSVFQRDCIILHSHQHCVRVSNAPHSCQNLILSFKFKKYIAILIKVCDILWF